MKLLRLLPFALLLAGCPDESGIPTENVDDYRMTFSAAEASSSCTDDIQTEAASFEEFSLIYRVHHVEVAADEPEAVVTNSRVDLYWREQGSNEDDFKYFAAGQLEGSQETGIFTYAATRLQEVRGGETVWYDIEGRAPVRFTDEITNATEDFIIVDPPASDGPPVGCVYTLHYDGTRLTGDDPEA